MSRIQPIKMKYGDGTLTFNVPSANLVDIIRADTAQAPSIHLASAVEPLLTQAVPDCSGRKVLVLIPDGTRDQRHLDGYLALAPLLRAASQVRVLIATGTHRADTPDDRRIISDIQAASTKHGLPLDSLEGHDCHHSQTDDYGQTSTGNRIRLNTRLSEADTVLIVSDMKPHYFAGYSNAIKFLLPGIAAFETIRHNHAFTLDPMAALCRHPLHNAPARRRNPVAEDQLEAARLVTGRKPVYALITVGGQSPSWATFGPIEAAVTEAIPVVDRLLARTLPQRYERVVISCGGYPNDETLYIAQRALELSGEIIADGAEVLWLVECRNGIASSQEATDNFFTPLKHGAEDYIRRAREHYTMFAHKTVKFVELLGRLTALHVLSTLPKGTMDIRTMRGCSTPNEAQKVVERWIASGERILFVDDANQLALTCGA
jgi:lactate racemase